MPAWRSAARVRTRGTAEEVARLGRELSRLDPWSFWVVPARADDVGEFLVFGTTGAFLVAVLGVEGYLTSSRGRMRIGSEPLRGLGDVRRAAGNLHGHLAAVGVFTDVVPILCLTRAAVGAPRTAHLVRLVGLDQVVREITGRAKVLLPGKAQRAAESLGMVLARNHRAQAREA